MTDSVYVDLIEDEPKDLTTWLNDINADDFDGQEHVQAAYNAYRNNFQPFRWHAENAGNHKIGALGERYFNKADAISNIKQQYGSQTTVWLRQAEHGNELLRRGYPNDLGEVIELAENLHVTSDGMEIDWNGVKYMRASHFEAIGSKTERTPRIPDSAYENGH